MTKFELDDFKKLDNWQCPFCGQNASITNNSKCIAPGNLITNDKSIYGNMFYNLIYITCPNSKCKEVIIDLVILINKTEYAAYEKKRDQFELFKAFHLIPKGRSKQYPDFIPEELRNDYEEACLILEDSPKASATLSRRCIQGIIRRYFGITKDRLYDEIKAIKDKLEPDLWKAIDSIREIGNIGAHSEKNVNIIINVKPEAAKALIGLVELLFEETYIKDFKRKSLIKKTIDAAKDIKTQKANNSEIEIDDDNSE